MGFGGEENPQRVGAGPLQVDNVQGRRVTGELPETKLSRQNTSRLPVTRVWTLRRDVVAGETGRLVWARSWMALVQLGFFPLTLGSH